MAEYLLPDKVVSIALSQVGYKEGANNWNKYAQELDSIGYFAPQKKQNVAWCSVFVDDIVYQASGKDKAKTYKALYQPSYDNLSAGCVYAAQYFRNHNAWSNTAVVGSQIFFGKKGSESHTGIVVSVGASTITTVEGNADNMVKKRSYNKNDSKIVGYGLIKYDQEPQPDPPTPTKDEYTVKTNTGDTLRIRAEATSKSKELGAIPNGKTVKAEAIVKGETVGGIDTWILTTYNGVKGYSSGKYLTPTPKIDPQPDPPTPTKRTFKVVTNSGDALRLRAKPTTDSEQVGYIDNGDLIEVESIVEGEDIKGVKTWALTSNGTHYKGNTSGYCSCKYLKEV